MTTGMTTGAKIFLDTAPLIYLLEAHPVFGPPTRAFLHAASAADARFCTSVLAWAEFGIKPARAGDSRWAAPLDELLDTLSCVPTPIDRRIAARAVAVRAHYPTVKSLDGLMLGTALALDCDTFLTNDRQLRPITELRVVLVSELAG